jgi:hypothetical protein
VDQPGSLDICISHRSAHDRPAISGDDVHGNSN